MSTTVPHNGSNMEAQFRAFLDDVAQLGKDKGNGEDAPARFALKVIETAYNGVIDLQRDKHGKGISDAHKAFEVYAQNVTAVRSFSDSTVDKLRSQIASFIKLGAWTKGGPGEPMKTVNKLMYDLQKLKKDKAYSGQTESAFNVLRKYASAQVKRTSVINDPAELRGFLLKPSRNPKTVIEILSGVANTLDKLAKGKLAHGACQDTSAEVMLAQENINGRISKLREEEAAASEATIEAELDDFLASASIGGAQ